MRTLNTVLAIQTATIINMLIFYLGKFPLIRRLNTKRLYAKSGFKKAMAIPIRIFIIIGGILLSLAYVGIVIYLPVVSLGQPLPQEDLLQQFYHMIFLLSFVVSGISSAIILTPKKSKYVAVKLMRMPPARFMHASFIYKYVTYFLYTLCAVWLFGRLLGGSVLEFVLLVLAATMWRVLFEYVHVKIFEKTNKVLVKENAVVWMVIVIGFAIAYAPLALGIAPFTGEVLLHLATVLVLTAAGVWAAWKLARYPDYRTVVDAATQRDDPLLDMGRMVTEANQSTVKVKDSDYSIADVRDLNDSKRLQSKKGYAYLNALFFNRHRSLVRRPVNIRLAVAAGIGILGLIVTQWFEPASMYVVEHFGTILSFSVLSMFYLTVGDNLCRAFFYHCDVKLLRYRFFREGSFGHFRIRLIHIVSRNLVIAATLGLVLAVVYWAATWTAYGVIDWLSLDLLMVWLGILSLAVFFSVYHLFMYYILQPYTTELNMKNPLFHVVNMIVSAICGFSLFIRVPAAGFALTILVVTLVFAVVALWMVHKYGSKTFRVK